MKTFILLTIGVIAAVCTQAQDFDYSFKERYEVGSRAELDLSSVDGNIDVASTTGSAIEVFYILKKAGRLQKVDRAHLEEDLIIESEHLKNRLKISVKHKHQDVGFNMFKDMSNVHFKVFVPRQTACRLTTSDGNISIATLASNQTCKTSDGYIEISDVSGDVYAKTSDGDVHVKQVTGVVDVGTSDGTISLKNVMGNVQALTSDGNIMLDKVKGNIAVKTSDGYIDFTEISGSFKASTSDGNIRGNVVYLREGLMLKTSGGNIHVALPSQMGLDLDIKAESIDVPFKNFTGKFEKTFVSGKSNGGGIPVVLSTSEGKVTLTY